jgi:hypothetical protein
MPRRGVNRSTALRLRTTARRLDGLLDAADQAFPREGAGGLKRDVQPRQHVGAFQHVFGSI